MLIMACPRIFIAKRERERQTRADKGVKVHEFAVHAHVLLEERERER